MIDGSWSREPAGWESQEGTLTATSMPRSDFWRTTHYGFVRDDGHLYGRPVAGDFTAVVQVSGDYRSQYDQAGLMLRRDPERWIKAGVELVDEAAWLSVVVTNHRSDWSLAAQVDRAAPRWLQLERTGEDLVIQHSPDGTNWTLMRVAWLPPGPADQVGPMLASPESESFTARFAQARIIVA